MGGALKTPVPVIAARCDNDPVWTLAMDVVESGWYMRKGWVVLGTDENETADRILTIWLHAWWRCWFCTDAWRPSGRTAQMLPLRAKDESAQKRLLPPLAKLRTAIMAAKSVRKMIEE